VAVHGEGGTGELKEVAKIAAGGFHALALLNNTEKTVKAWGANEYGQLGNGKTEEKSTGNPFKVEKLTGVTAIAGGFTHSVALLGNGKVETWGENHSGELGNNSETASDVPVEVGQGLGEVAGISAGTEFTVSTGAPAPTVTEVHPKTGPEAGGTPVIITGTNFTGATAVKFGSANAIGFTEKSATSIEATSPKETEKMSPVDVTVTTPAMISRSSEKDRFNYRAAGLKATDWAVNYIPLGLSPSRALDWGTLTLENTYDHSLVGKVTCHALMGGSLFNEGEAGFGHIEGFSTFGCVKEPTACPGAFITAEEKIRPVEETNGTEKIVIGGKHGPSFLPWESEMYETENTEKKQRVLKDKIENMELTLVLPCEPLPGVETEEYRFKGTLEPLVVNGAGNGLSSSHLKFEGKGGQTGHLSATDFVAFEASEKETPISGELTMSGSEQQLITAE
jgi:IPT/TIG domain/Regulator of chromosome condensation (RCC1) repeat